MSLARRARLARLTPRIIKPVWPDPEKHRHGLLRHVEFCEVIRQALSVLGIDPARVKTLSSHDEALTELAEMGIAPEPPDPTRFPRAYLFGAPADATREAEAAPPRPLLPDDRRAILSAKLERLVQSYLRNPEIDFGKASLMEVFTWCAARFEERFWASRQTEAKPAGGSEFAAD